MTQMVKIEVVLPQKEATAVVSMVADKAVELHTSLVPNGVIPTPVRTKSKTGPWVLTSEQALAQAKKQKGVQVLLGLAIKQAAFTKEQGRAALVNAGYAPTGLGPAVSRLVRAGLARKIEKNKWEFDRAALKAHNFL